MTFITTKLQDIHEDKNDYDDNDNSNDSENYRDNQDDLNKTNKSPKGIMRSAGPLPCFFDVVKSKRVAGQRPR